MTNHILVFDVYEDLISMNMFVHNVHKHELVDEQLENVMEYLKKNIVMIKLFYLIIKLLKIVFFFANGKLIFYFLIPKTSNHMPHEPK